MQIIYALESYIKDILSNHIGGCNVIKNNFAFGNSLTIHACEPYNITLQAITYMKENVERQHNSLLDNSGENPDLYSAYCV